MRTLRRPRGVDDLRRFVDFIARHHYLNFGDDSVWIGLVEPAAQMCFGRRVSERQLHVVVELALA